MNNIPRNTFRLLPSLLLTVLICAPLTTLPTQAAPTDALRPGEIRTDATFEHIGALWWVEGDNDLDSRMTMEFRQADEALWLPAAPAMRAYPSLRVDDRALGLNYWAASAMFLEPGVDYELRLTLTDPDGGSQTRVVSASTRTPLRPDLAGRQLYAIPGSGGGAGSQSDPFRGLQTAADAAQPSDTIHSLPGVYEPFELLVSGTAGGPITILGPGDGSAIIDGRGTDRGVVTLGRYDQTLGYVILHGLTIQNGHWGIDAQHTHDIQINHNTIQAVDFGVYNRRGDALEGNQTVCDNLITGRTPWPQTGGEIPSERGIDLRGYGNVVCHNDVRNFGDCISVQPYTGASYGNDVYGNQVSSCVDDGIEIDYNQSNARVWLNQVLNARMGVSVQPIRGGPAYIFRNAFFNLESVPVKMHNYTTGFYVAHNTGVKHGNAYGDNGAMWRNAVLRNNLFLGTRYAFEFTTVADEGFRDLDYNAWGASRAIGSPDDSYFKWDNERYDRLVDLPPGVEDHGLEIDFSHLTHASLPSDWFNPVEPQAIDLRLVTGAPAIDKGLDLPNLNEAFTLSGQPDMGAYEYGQPLPHYGPRPLLPDLGLSNKLASDTSPDYGETVAFTVTLQNRGAPLTTTLTLTDTLPPGLVYIPGSLDASNGQVEDAHAPELRWQGELSGSQPVKITYQATIATRDPQPIRNSAVLASSSNRLLELSATLITNPLHSYLPVVKN